MSCLSDVLLIPALLAEGVEGEGLAAGSDGMTVLLSDLPARWEGQASMLWCKVTLAGAPRAPAAVPSHPVLGMALVASVPAAGGWLCWRCRDKRCCWGTDFHTAEQDGKGLFPTERSEGDAAGGKPWPAEAVPCTGRVLCGWCSLLRSRQQEMMSLLALFFILAIKNLHKCSTLIMGCTYFALTTFGSH